MDAAARRTRPGRIGLSQLRDRSREGGEYEGS